MSSIAAQPQAPPSEVIFGIAKKIHLELEKLPLHTHAIVMNMLRGMVEHRKVELDNQVAEANAKANDEAMSEARRAHAEKQAQYEAQIAAQIKAHAPKGDVAVAEPAKAPRLSIVLGKDEEQQPAQELVATL